MKGKQKTSKWYKLSKLCTKTKVMLHSTCSTQCFRVCRSTFNQQRVTAALQTGFTMGLLKRTSNQARACESCEAAVAHCSSCFTVLAQRDYLSLCSCWTTPPLLSSHSFEINATKDQSECSLKENYDCS